MQDSPDHSEVHQILVLALAAIPIVLTLLVLGAFQTGDVAGTLQLFAAACGMLGALGLWMSRRLAWPRGSRTVFSSVALTLVAPEALSLTGLSDSSARLLAVSLMTGVAVLVWFAVFKLRRHLGSSGRSKVS